MMTWLTANWEWVLLGFYIVEKVVKLTPTTKDDVLFDMVLEPLFNAIRVKK